VKRREEGDLRRSRMEEVNEGTERRVVVIVRVSNLLWLRHRRKKLALPSRDSFEDCLDTAADYDEGECKTAGDSKGGQWGREGDTERERERGQER
jgi:hypothetical protein